MSEPEHDENRPLQVLVVDDDRNIRRTLALCLRGLGCHATEAGSGAEALASAERALFDLVFLDLRLGQESGLDLLPQLLAATPGAAIVLVTAYGTVETAVAAMKRGATDYLPKPFTPAQIQHLVSQVTERRTLRRRLVELEAIVQREVPESDLASESKVMRATLELVAKVALARAPVLLRGESGTGKGVLARAVHAQSPRRAAPFVVVNCPTLSQELLASELFGHTRGAFTGAVVDQPGRVEAAEGGTLFLDEIGEISSGLQAKLLRFVQEHQFERIGETRTRRADVRLIAATNRDLESDVRSGRFREDLLYRLNVVEIAVPPLRDRPEDIPRLAQRFLSFFAAQMGRPEPTLSEKAAQAIASYRWPGNVRELRNAMERAVILWPSRVIELEALPERIAGQARHPPHLGGDFTLAEIEREHLLRVQARTSTLEEAARILGIDDSTLWRKRKKLEEGG